MTPEELLGQKYVFPDGNSIEVIQIKTGELHGDLTEIITYQVGSLTGIPRRHVMGYTEFVNTFGHLFEGGQD